MGIRNVIDDKGFVSYLDEEDINTLTIESDITATSVMKGQRTNVVTVTSSTIITTESASIILVSTSGTAITITLPDVQSLDGYTLKIKKIDETNGDVIIRPVVGKLIDGETQKTITLAYTTITIVSKDGDWWIV